MLQRTGTIWICMFNSMIAVFVRGGVEDIVSRLIAVLETETEQGLGLEIENI